MALLVVGSVALDSLQTPFGVREDVLGGSATYFSTAASFFTPARVVAVVGEDFPEVHVDFLRGRGVDVSGLERRPGRTFRWKGRYEFDLNQAHTLDTQLNVFADFRPQLPESFRDSTHVFLGNIDPELQSQVLDQVRAPRIVAADTMNFWIASKKKALQDVLRRVDLLFVNDAEARQLAGEHNVVKAARAILDMGPRAVVVKRGEYGALFFSGTEVFASSAYPLAELFDPTGAGDSFAGGFMGYLARSGSLDPAAMRRAIVVGSVLASFAVERFSLDRLRDLGPHEIRARYAEFRRLAHFDDLDVDVLPVNAGRDMRIAVLSDVHANLEALVEVERAIGERGVDLVASLGDVVGYGASPNECCEIVRRIAGVTLLGNHDAAVAGRMDYGFYYDAARNALDWTAGVLTRENREWLVGLPYAGRVGDVGFSHGSPLRPEDYDYVLATEQAAELLPVVEQLPRVTFIGHSHLTKVFALRAGSEVLEVSGKRFTMREGYRYLVTVGAVGQPRDYDNRACFVLHDTDAGTVEYVRVPYDIESAAQRIFSARVAASFGRRLFLGV